MLWVAAALIFGLSLGYLLRDQVFADGPVAPEIITETEVVTEAISDERLQSLCATLTASDRDRLESAQADIMSLRRSLEGKELELAALQEERRRAKEAGAAVVSRIKALEAEVATLKTELATITEERDTLLVELKETVVKLEHQIRETDKYKKEAKKWKRKSTENAWKSFVAEAKVLICDRGTRKRHEACHEAVADAMAGGIQDRFELCVDTYQATPSMAQLERKASLPTFAEALDNDKAFTSKDWYIQFCDPTLPEAGE